MRILQLIDAFNPENYGGAGRVFFETSKQLVSLGCVVDVICRTDNPDAFKKFNNINFFLFHDIQAGPLKKFLYYKKNVQSLFGQYLEQYSPDAIVMHSSVSAIGLGKFLKHLNIPKIYYFHSPWHKEYEICIRNFISYIFNIPLTFIRKNHEDAYLNIADGIITLSQYMHNEMIVYHKTISSKHYRILPGAADPELFYPPKDHLHKLAIRKELNLSESNTYIIVSRRLIERTGIDLILKAFDFMINKYPDYNFENLKLIITGRGNKEEFFKKLSHDLKLDPFVLFTGYLSEDKLADFYRASDLFVIPSKSLEGFGLATVEAMASGLPVIGTAVGGTKEILMQLDEELLIQSITSEAIADKIYFMLNQDLSLWGKKTLKFYNENFSWNKHSRDLRSFISEINNFH